jgi:hypothetical protein
MEAFEIIKNFKYPGEQNDPLDVFAGVILGYEMTHILPWVNSIEQSGFNGLKIMIVYHTSAITVQTLRDRGWLVITFESIPQQGIYSYNMNKDYSSPNYLTNKKYHICVERFYHLWYFLSKLPDHIKDRCRYITATDVKDIIFQSNPFEWIHQNIESGKKIIAITESITYEKETNFGAKNLINSFGNNMFEHMKTRLIYNAGTLAGEFNTMVDLFLQIFMMSMGGNLNELQPDQAAYNILLSLEPFKSVTMYMNSEDGWAAQLGTCWSHTMFEGKLSEPIPIFNSDTGLLCTTKNKPYVIVHQYDRIPHLTHFYNNKYR